MMPTNERGVRVRQLYGFRDDLVDNNRRAIVIATPTMGMLMSCGPGWPSLPDCLAQEPLGDIIGCILDQLGEIEADKSKQQDAELHQRI